MAVFSVPQLLGVLAATPDMLAEAIEHTMRSIHVNMFYLACAGAWLGSQPSELLSARRKLLVAGFVCSCIEGTFVAMAIRGRSELLARHHAFIAPFLGAFLLLLALTRASERRARLTRAHGKELVAQQRQLLELEQQVGALSREKQHLVEERKLFTRAMYNKFLRETTGRTRSSAGVKPVGGERKSSPLRSDRSLEPEPEPMPPEGRRIVWNSKLWATQSLTNQGQEL